MDYNIINDYLSKGEKFNLTGDANYPIYIYEFSDEELNKEYNNIYTTEKLHWKEEWEFIFNHAIIERRKRKINKILKR